MAAGEGVHLSLLHLLPGYENVAHALGQRLGRPFLGELPPDQPIEVTHVVLGVLVFFVAIGLVLRAGFRRLDVEQRIVPEERLTLRTFFELLVEALLSVMREIIGPRHAERFLPLVGSLAVFILFSNLLGLVPGFMPPTDSLNTTVALALPVFLVTHIEGFREHGFKYIKQFLGPVIWLAPLMMPIELISHLARPLSLSLRLFGNMMGDHKVMAMFLGLFPFIVPLPMLALGVLICIVQTMVFT
ncbi:MAG: F0F1 ATP synthase subunit A, partial [Deltaproteobacteria bacterium]|nr:F0F1 ATP synthase subunit A [Deltaproteobacteria bacterium]